MYSHLSEHYLSWGMGKRPSLLLAGERAVYKKPLVGKLPHTAAQMLMIQRCNSSTNIWTQSVAQVHLEEIRLKCQCTWKCNHFTKETAKDSKGPLFHSAGSETLKPLPLTMFVYHIKIKSNKHCQQSIAIITCKAGKAGNSPEETSQHLPPRNSQASPLLSNLPAFNQNKQTAILIVFWLTCNFIQNVIRPLLVM